VEGAVAVPRYLLFFEVFEIGWRGGRTPGRNDRAARKGNEGERGGLRGDWI